MQKTATTYLLLITFVAAIGGFLFGYDWVVIGGAKPFYEAYFHLESDVALQGWAMSSAIVGSFIGVLLSGGLADRYGRKPLIYTAAILFIISALGTGMVYGFGDAFFQPPDIPRSGWKVIAVSSEWIGGGEKENILDGNKDIFWHNIWMGGEPPLPHYVIIDFGKEYEVMMIELTRRLWNNDLKVVEFSTSGGQDRFWNK